MGVYRRGTNWYIDFYAEGGQVRQRISQSKKVAERVLNKLKTAVIENRYLDVKKKRKIKFETLVERHLKYAKGATSLMGSG